MTTTTDIDLHFPEFPFYITAKARIVRDENDREGGTVRVTVSSSIHEPKERTMGLSWSYKFFRKKRNEFLGDVMVFIIRTYGLKRNPVTYS